MVALCEDHALSQVTLWHSNKASTLIVKYFSFLWSVYMTVMPFSSKASVIIFFSSASSMTTRPLILQIYMMLAI